MTGLSVHFMLKIRTILSENRCCIEQVFGDGDCSTVSFKLSPDLINWSESTVIRKCICKGGEWEIYPSLMDPRSPSDSFDTVGKTASLFHVNLHGRQIWSYDLEFGGVEGAEGDWLEQGSEIGQLTTDDDLKERLGPLKTDDVSGSYLQRQGECERTATCTLPSQNYLLWRA